MKARSREWLGLLGIAVIGGGLLAIAAVEAGTDSGGWIAFGFSAAVGVVAVLAYALVVGRRYGFFLRNEAEVERNRVRTAAHVRVAWVLVGAGVVASGFGGLPRVVAAALMGGAILGSWPFVIANFVRLWREKWAR